MFNKEIPPKIIQDILILSIPLLLISSNRSNHSNQDYWHAIIGSGIGMIPFFPNNSAKPRLIICSLLYLISVIKPSFYYFCFGYILHHSYNLKILISNPKSVCKLVSKVELIGYMFSESIVLPFNLKIFLGCLSLISSILLNQLYTEVVDPFDLMKSKIESASILNIEYRALISSKKPILSWKVYPIDILLMIADRKMSFLFGMIFSFEISEVVIFLIGILYIFEIPWEIFCIFLKTFPNSNTLIRTIITYIIFYIIDFLKANTLFTS